MNIPDLTVTRLRRLVVASLALLLSNALPAAAIEPQTFADVDRIFADWSLDAHVPGLVYGIVQDGRLVHAQGFGAQEPSSKRRVSAETLFRIASMSKAFTALAILKLRDEGKIMLDAPAETYVPEMKGWHYPTSDSPRISVRNLLTHSAGFVEDNPWGDRQQVLPEEDFTALLLVGPPFARAPGLGMEYSNYGYAILGRIVSNVSGQRYQDYIQTHIMRPLSMGSTSYDILSSPISRRAIGYRWQDNALVREPDMKDGAFGAMGGIETSANDYAKWVAFLLDAWPSRDDVERGPVKRSTVREIVTGLNFAGGRMRPPAIGGVPCRQAVAYAMAWNVVDDCDLGRIVTHTGGYPGYGSVVMLLPDKGIGIFAFASRTYGAPSLPAFRALLALQKVAPVEDRRLPVSSGLANAYTAARAVWRAGVIDAAPLAGNMLLDRDAAHWKTMLAGLRSEVGTCAADEEVTPTSALEGRFIWKCEHGRISGRVQRAPLPEVRLQALEFAIQAP
jgi:D-alanyl-D-alanine-carboxypeptidase/D-alanyl-D-alanine-endopeptidase